MSEPKFTKGPLTAFEVDIPKLKNCKDYGIQDKDRTVLCWTTSGPKETRKANVNLWAASPELYDFANFFETFAGQCYCKILGEAGQKIYDEAVKICKKARGEE